MWFQFVQSSVFFSLTKTKTEIFVDKNKLIFFTNATTTTKIRQFSSTKRKLKLKFKLLRKTTTKIWLFSSLYYFVSDCTLHACVLCSIVTQWAGPGGIEAWSLGPLLPSVLWHCWLGKPVPDMTCNVFSGTLNPTQSINQSTMQSNEQHFIIVITFRLNYHSD